jgi:hypothetical protein
MMGMVFTELLDMVESKFSLDMVDAIVARAGAKGSYTSVGNYDDEELVKLVVALGDETGIAVPQLLHAYGVHLFGRFVALFPGFFAPHDSAAGFFAGLESHVHTEVRKLYANARPPLFSLERNDDGSLFLDYRSARGLWQFAQGLVEACLAHFGAKQRVADVRDLSGGAGTHVRFVLVDA